MLKSHLILFLFLTLPIQGFCEGLRCGALFEKNDASSIDQTGVFSNASIFDFYMAHPEVASTFIAKWYGAKFLAEWGPKVRFPNLDATVLLLDPGIVDRINEFINFSNDFLATHQVQRPQELREGFRAYLGKSRFYRGMILTDAQAEAIMENGLVSPGLFSGRTTLASWFDLKKRNGPVQDAVDRVLKDNENRGLTISVSDYKEIATAAASYRLSQTDRTQYIYLFEIVTDELNVVRINQKISTLRAFKKLRDVTFDQSIVVGSPDHIFFNAAWSLGSAEAFIYNSIAPSDLISVSKIPDQRPWQIEMIGSTKGTTSLDDIERPKRKFQVAEDPDFNF